MDLKPTATPAVITPTNALNQGSKSADSKSVQQVSDIVSSLLESMPSITNPTTAATAADIYVALHNDDELFLLTKVLLLTRQGKARSHVEDGLFKLLVAMRPEVDAQKAIDLILPNTPLGCERWVSDPLVSVFFFRWATILFLNYHRYWRGTSRYIHTLRNCL